MRALFAIIAKDLKLFFANPRAVVITLAVPIAIASFFGMITAPKKKNPLGSGVPVWVVNHDPGEITTAILGAMTNDVSLKISLHEEDEARRGVAEGKVPVVVVIPPDFGERAAQSFFAPQGKPELTILSDPSRSIEAAMVKGLLMQHIMQTVSQRIFSPTQGRKWVAQGLSALSNASAQGLPEVPSTVLRDLLKSVDRWMEESAKDTNGGLLGGTQGFSMPFTTRSEEVTNKKGSEYNGYAHSFGGMGVQFILMHSVEAGVAMLYERRFGRWRRLRAAPVSRATLLAGRALSCTLISLLTLGACWLFAVLVFNVTISGSLVGFLACNVAIALFSSTVALLLAAIGGTPEATRGISIFAVLMLVMLGGAWVPAFVFPEWLQTITLVIPTRWAVDSLDAMTWRGLGLGSAMAPIAVLLGYSVLFAGLALWRSRADQGT